MKTNLTNYDTLWTIETISVHNIIIFLSKSISAVLRLIFYAYLFYARNEGSNNYNTTGIDRFVLKTQKSSRTEKASQKKKIHFAAVTTYTLALSGRKYFYHNWGDRLLNHRVKEIMSKTIYDQIWCVCITVIYIGNRVVCVDTRYIIHYDSACASAILFSSSFRITMYIVVYLHDCALIFQVNFRVLKKKSCSHFEVPCIFIILNFYKHWSRRLLRVFSSY